MNTSTTPPLLEVDDLHVRFNGPAGPVPAVRGVSLRLGRERLAVVGESGSGKSVSFRALLGLLPASAQVSGQARFAGAPLLGLDEKQQSALRGRRIGMIVQDPRQGLNPQRNVGAQLQEMLRWHWSLSSQQARHRALELLADVDIREPQRVMALYPHQLSGGMGQRVMIAMVLAGEPDLLIADEATSALDSMVRRTILDLIDRQVRQRNMGLVLISHDLDLVAGFADRVLVMYAGRVVETLAGGAVHAARHPYSQGLLACRPSLARSGHDLPTLQRDPAWAV
ncbi:ABC transporter ATP-binding protein [Pseudomonas sp. P5_152]|uniref:ABC transporter ATP-binding protein n=1 Tax=Pseudomonas sp. P5_152 TaxID=3043442 RepID=UPI002A3594E3|nr:ABC transporter ATP-binding protein [Pseudomonas sp. P5_152]MDX9663694.1 ABC transporter ATP-binding protein [Pseudomonas sp. P5_152]